MSKAKYPYFIRVFSDTFLDDLASKLYKIFCFFLPSLRRVNVVDIYRHMAVDMEVFKGQKYIVEGAFCRNDLDPILFGIDCLTQDGLRRMVAIGMIVGVPGVIVMVRVMAAVTMGVKVICMMIMVAAMRIAMAVRIMRILRRSSHDRRFLPTAEASDREAFRDKSRPDPCPGTGQCIADDV